MGIQGKTLLLASAVAQQQSALCYFSVPLSRTGRWQRDLSVSFDRVGNVLVAQGNLPEALKSYRDSLAIRDRLAKSDPGNAGWQRDLSVSYNRIGEVQ